MTVDEEIELSERPISPLRHLHDTAVSLEKLRISLGNRVAAMERGVDSARRPVPEIYSRLHKMAEDMEKEADGAIQAELETWEVYNQWLSHIKGIGPSLSGQLLALLLPPIPAKGPSSWFKAAGLVPQRQPDGMMRLPRPRALACPECGGTEFSTRGGKRVCKNPDCQHELEPGEGRIAYHPWLRRCLYNVATSFVRNGGFYREAYERNKDRLQQQHSGQSGWPAIRIDRSARWATIKLFLSHLWEAWCAAEGIHNRGPYGLTTLPDGTQVIREMLPDGATRDHAYQPRPLPQGKGRI